MRSIKILMQSGFMDWNPIYINALSMCIFLNKLLTVNRLVGFAVGKAYRIAKDSLR